MRSITTFAIILRAPGIYHTLLKHFIMAKGLVTPVMFMEIPREFRKPSEVPRVVLLPSFARRLFLLFRQRYKSIHMLFFRDITGPPKGHKGRFTWSPTGWLRENSGSLRRFAVASRYNWHIKLFFMERRRLSNYWVWSVQALT